MHFVHFVGQKLDKIMSKDLLPTLIFPSMMALKFVSDFSSKSCNVLSNNPTGPPTLLVLRYAIISF